MWKKTSLDDTTLYRRNQYPALQHARGGFIRFFGGFQGNDSEAP